MEWNQAAENAPSVMPYACGDYILSFGEITHQDCGLDKNFDKLLSKLVEVLGWGEVIRTPE